MPISTRPKNEAVPVSHRFISFVIVAVLILQHLLIFSPVSAGAATGPALLADPIPTVVVNKYFNSGTAAGDIVELLVIQNNLDMRGMIIKDFSASMVNDGGGKFTFSTNSLWSTVPAGTLIVLRNNTSAA